MKGFVCALVCLSAYVAPLFKASEIALGSDVTGRYEIWRQSMAI